MDSVNKRDLPVAYPLERGIFLGKKVESCRRVVEYWVKKKIATPPV